MVFFCVFGHEMAFSDWKNGQKDIINWIYNEKKALLVIGARQIGETYLIQNTLGN